MNPRANAPLATQIIASTHSKLFHSSFEDLVAKQQLTERVKLRVHQNQRTNNMGSLVRKYKF